MLIGGVIQTDFLQKPNNIQKLKVPPALDGSRAMRYWEHA